MPQHFQTYEAGIARVDWFRAKLQCELGPVELNRLIDEKSSILVVDVRDSDSFAQEHIAGAINIPQHDLPKRFSEIPKDKTIVCYCWSAVCYMAAKACLDLAEHDYKVLELHGGIKGWKDAGFPLQGEGGDTAHA